MPLVVLHAPETIYRTMMCDSNTDDIYRYATECPIRDYTVVSLGVDWRVKAYVKDSASQEFCDPVYIRVGDIPRICRQPAPSSA